MKHRVYLRCRQTRCHSNNIMNSLPITEATRNRSVHCQLSHMHLIC